MHQYSRSKVPSIHPSIHPERDEKFSCVSRFEHFLNSAQRSLFSITRSKKSLHYHPANLHFLQKPVFHHELFACWVILQVFFDVCWFFFKINFFEKFFQEYDQSVNQFASRSGLTFCWAWSGSKLLAKVFSRRQKSSLAGKALKLFNMQLKLLGREKWE